MGEGHAGGGSGVPCCKCIYYILYSIQILEYSMSTVEYSVC